MIFAPALRTRWSRFLSGRPKMEADNLRVQLHKKITHFVIEGSTGGGRHESVVIDSQLDVVGIQTSPPVIFTSRVVARLLVTEEVHIDRARCLSSNGFKLLARLFNAQQGTSKGTEPSSLRNGDRQIRKSRSSHRRLDNWYLNVE